MDTLKIYTLFIFLFSCTILSSCKKEPIETDFGTEEEPPVIPPPAFQFNFIKLNNVSTYDVGVNMFSITDTFTSSATLKIISDLGSGKFEKELVINTPIVASTDTVTWHKDTTALSDFDKPGTKYRVLRGNPVVNEKYPGLINGTDTLYRLVISQSQSVSVPAGSFTCAVIKEYTSSNPLPDKNYKLFYFDKNKGLVKREDFQNGILTMNLLLRSANF